MRTTLNLKDDLVKQAQELTGIEEKTALIHRGLELLIQKEAAQRLIKLGGSDSSAKASSRKKYTRS
jgi:hypothetical protein